MPQFKISKEYWPTIEMNQDNLKATWLWFSMHMVFEDQDNQHLQAFVKNSYYGALDKVLIGDRNLPFDIDAVSRCLRLL
jgi:hypothetical protein